MEEVSVGAGPAHNRCSGLGTSTFSPYLNPRELHMSPCYRPLTGPLAAGPILSSAGITCALGGRFFSGPAAGGRQALAVDGTHNREQVWGANLTLIPGTKCLLCVGLQAGSVGTGQTGKSPNYHTGQDKKRPWAPSGPHSRRTGDTRGA